MLRVIPKVDPSSFHYDATRGVRARKTVSSFCILISSPSARSVGRGSFAESARIRMNRTAPNGEFPFAQGIEHPQLFRHGPRGEIAAQGAFACENLLQVKAHGASFNLMSTLQ